MTTARVAAMVRAHRVPVVLMLLVAAVVGPVVSLYTAQPASRLSLTAALVEQRSVDLGPYRDALGLDRATYNGHLRSDKAPGQSLFAVPAYVAVRLVGSESARHLRVESNLGLWFVTLWSATLPLAALLAMLYVTCARFAGRSVACIVVLAFGFGTILLPYSANLFGHDLAAALGFGAWFALERTPLSARRARVAGFLAGAAVLVEYQAAIIACVLLVFLAVRERRRVRDFAAGALAPLIVLAGYHWRAFGAPWRTPAAFYSGVIDGTSEGGYSIPTVHRLLQIFGGERGLWVGAPIALIAIGCAVWQVGAGDRPAVRTHAIVALAIVIPYIVLSAGWSGTWLLEDPGPRYLIPSLPFLAVPLAAGWNRVRAVAVPVAIFGVLLAAASTWTQLLVPRGTSVLTADRFRVQHHMFASTLWSMGLGPAGTIAYGASVGGVGALLVRAVRKRTGVRLDGSGGIVSP